MQLETYEALLKAIRGHSESGKRILVAIVGAPGAGKSTIVERFSNDLAGCAVLPMDGFHLDNEILIERDRLHRKGAPDTFDTAALRALVAAIKEGGGHKVPTFDRDNDKVVPSGGNIPADAETILVEGNYLLLDAPEWSELADYWDVSVMLDVPLQELEQRLVRRWLEQGLSPEDAKKRAHENDLANAKTVQMRSRPATYRLTLFE